MLAMNTPVVSTWIESNSSASLISHFIMVGFGCVLLKMGVSKFLMSHIKSRFEQDVIDSQSDDLDKDVIERLSTIEKYTVLRSDSAFTVVD